MPFARTLPILALLLCGMHATLARAACAQADAIVRHAYPDARPDPDGGYRLGERSITPSSDDIGDAGDVVCKVWPEHPELTLALVPLMSPGSDQGNEGDLDLLLLDSGNLKLLQRLRLPGYMDDDAIRIEDIKLDTARYRLAPGTLAFGVRKTLEGSSGPDPFEEVDLSLYAVINGKLRTVLDGLAVSRSNGEWDTQCAGTFDSRHLLLSTGDAMTRGLADIDISGSDDTHASRLDSHQQCTDTPGKHTPIKARLHYDGQHYVVPKELASLQ